MIAPGPGGRRRAGAGAQLSAAMLVLVAAGASLAGCTSAPEPSSSAKSPASARVAPVADPITAARTTAPAAAAVPTVTKPAVSRPATRTSAPWPTAASTYPPPAGATPSPAPRSTCAHLAIRVLRGSAAGGREFAALQFTNVGSTTCRLNGYPTVTLLRGGQRIGSASQPASSTMSTYRLAPGATAESHLNDYVGCNAPLSDQLRVIAPGSSLTAVRPAQLRACTLRVSAFGAPQ